MSEDSTVRKVAEFLIYKYLGYPTNFKIYKDQFPLTFSDAEEIIKIVHESEDSDE